MLEYSNSTVRSRIEAEHGIPPFSATPEPARRLHTSNLDGNQGWGCGPLWTVVGDWRQSKFSSVARKESMPSNVKYHSDHVLSVENLVAC